MQFYEQLSKYYDYIFPVGEAQLKFIKETVGKPSKVILDVACGSGGYSVELAKSGYCVEAVDLDRQMISAANKKLLDIGQNAKAVVCDMKKLEQNFDKNFDCIFCIGNSIVHIGSKKEIKDTIMQMYNLLNEQGHLILQIINFDRILKYEISELPEIKNEAIGLKFIREYKLQKNTGLINFNTVLTLEEENLRFENSVELFPLLKEDVFQMLKVAGFKEINFYGDFNKSVYDENSFMLVAKAKK